MFVNTTISIDIIYNDSNHRQINSFTRCVFYKHGMLLLLNSFPDIVSHTIKIIPIR